MNALSTPATQPSAVVAQPPVASRLVELLGLFVLVPLLMRWRVVAVPRLTTGILAAGDHSFAPKVWEKHVLSLPQDAPEDWINLFTGEKIASPVRQRSKSLPLDRLFKNLPVALLQGRSG